MLIELTKGYHAEIDDEDYHLVAPYKWFTHFSGSGKPYAIATPYIKGIGRKTILMSRLIMGVTDSKIEIDHIDGVRLDNRKSNLREVTHRQNMWNLPVSKINTTGYKGVAKNGYGRFVARISKDNKIINLGTFATAIEAAIAYNKAVPIYHGEYGRINIIPDGIEIPSTKIERRRNLGLSKLNKSGYLGVSWSAQRKKWWAQIRYKGKTISLGFYENPEDAARAYDAKQKELFGSEAWLNFSI